MFRKSRRNRKPPVIFYNMPSGTEKNLLDLNLEELQQVPQFLTFKNFIDVPSEIKDWGESAPIIYRYYDFGYRALLQKKHTPILEKLFKDFVQTYFSVSDDASTFETLYSIMDHKKKLFIEKRVEAECFKMIKRERQEVLKKIAKADKAFPWFKEKIKNFDSLEQDIALHTIMIDEVIDSRQISLAAFCDNSVSGILARLKTLHNPVAVYRKLRPDSEFLHQGVIDVDDSNMGSTSKWMDQKLMMLDSPLNTMDEDNLKSDFKKITLLEPKVKLQDVVLPEKTKRHLTALMENYKLQRKKKKSLHLMLIGTPGTGKTMTANAVATELGVPLLKVQLADIERKFMPNLVSYVLTRARLKKALVLFEECEDLLWTSYLAEISSPWMKTLLEDYEGCCIFTSNYKVGQDFLRRMDYVIDYKIPSPTERAILLKKKLEDQNLEVTDGFEPIEKALAKTSLSGGYFQQVIDLSHALASEENTISAANIVEAIETIQTTHRLNSAEHSKIPQAQLLDLKLNPHANKTMQQFIAFTKRKSTDHRLPFKGGCVGLFYGPSGTGKTMAAEAVANDLGLKLKKITASDLLSKWIGETEKNIRKQFEEARTDGHVLFIDEAEGLMSSRENAQRSWEITQVNEFLRQVEEFEGVLILATNHREFIDPAMGRRFLFHIEFERPDPSTRLEIWKSWIEHLALAPTELEDLAKNYELTGGDIVNVVKKYIAWDKNDVSDLHRLCRQQLGQQTGSKTSQIGF